MFSGGDYEEVGRWLLNFLNAHAKRECPRVEGVLEPLGAPGQGYGLRLRLGSRHVPPLSEPPLEVTYSEAAGHRGRLEWCSALAGRVRGLARQLAEADRGSKKPA